MLGRQLMTGANREPETESRLSLLAKYLLSV
jgi:hypothetical protein